MKIINFEVYEVSKDFINGNSYKSVDNNVLVVPISRDQEGALKFIRLDDYSEQYFYTDGTDCEVSEDDMFSAFLQRSFIKIDLIEMYIKYLERYTIELCESEPMMMKKYIESNLEILKLLKK